MTARLSALCRIVHKRHDGLPEPCGPGGDKSNITGVAPPFDLKNTVRNLPRLGFGLLAICLTPVYAQTPVGNDFFEKEIRPVLAEKCYGCHSSKLKSPMGGLVLDTKGGMKKGGNGGPVLTPGDPKSSRLLS